MHCRKQYGAERMCLALLGGEPLDTLQAWAAELFSGVRGGHCGAAPTFEGQGMPFQVRGAASHLSNHNTPRGASSRAHGQAANGCILASSPTATAPPCSHSLSVSRP